MDELVLVVGFGQTGQSIARYLKRKKIAFDVFDTRKMPPGADAFLEQYPGVSLYLEHYPEEKLNDVTRIVCSPGVALNTPVLETARRRDILIESDIDCFAREVTAPIVAITGTNGKSTVTSLVGEMARASGINVGVAGNIGTPVLDSLQDEQTRDASLWVLELSSFQLEITHDLKPKAAAFLNLSEDHLDRHTDITAYAAAKQRVYRGAEILLFNRDDVATYPDETYLDDGATEVNYGQGVPKDASSWGVRLDIKRKPWLAEGKAKWLLVSDLKLQGTHNILNALAALALARAIDLPRAACIETLKTFDGLPHRCQKVRVLDGVTWINDSKGTNVGATDAAIQGIGPLLEGKIVLIAGGQGKGAAFDALREGVKAHVRLLILIGEDAQVLDDALGDVVTVIHASSMIDAIGCAKACAHPKDVVLLSPACASFDWFRDFNHRGEVFTQLVEGL